MQKKLAFLLLAVGINACLVGCQATNTAAIIDNYGVLKDSEVVSLIQSGQADYMVENGHVKVEHDVRGSGADRVLVTKYIIQGEVYRIEVRRAINPLENVPWDRVRYAETTFGPTERVISWLHLAEVLDALKDNSYAAQAEVAYRAWRDMDGRVHPARVMKGPEPNWRMTEDAVQLTIRTKEWPVADMWFTGLTSDARTAAGSLGYDVAQNVPASEREGENIPDGRWIVRAKGPGVDKPNFINLKLYEAIQLGGRER